jgi:hypothetical protein
MTVGFPPSMTAIQELVVPRSIPTILAMITSSIKLLLDVENIHFQQFTGGESFR